MKNFVKTSGELVNGSVVISETLMPRSLVCVNTKNMSVFNIVAKCRNSDKFSICRSMAKAVLTAIAEASKVNSTEAALEAKKRVTNPMVSALSSQYILLTDKNGKLIQDAGVSVLAETGDASANLRNVFRFSKQQPLYKLVVEEGKSWEDEAVVRALNVWTTAAIEQMGYLKNLDEALGVAAETTARLDKAGVVDAEIVEEIKVPEVAAETVTEVAAEVAAPAKKRGGRRKKSATEVAAVAAAV